MGFMQKLTPGPWSLAASSELLDTTVVKALPVLGNFVVKPPPATLAYAKLFDIRKNIVDDVASSRQFAEESIEYVTQCFESGQKFVYTIHDTGDTGVHAYSMFYRYGLDFELVRKYRMDPQLLLLSCTPGMRSFVCSAENFAARTMGAPASDLDFLRGSDCDIHLFDPLAPGTEATHGLLLGADNITLKRYQPVKVGPLWTQPNLATTIPGYHVLDGQLGHFPVSYKGAMGHYWLGFGKSTPRTGVMSLQDQINLVVPPMWMVSAANVDFLVRNMSQLGVSLSEFDGRVMDPEKPWVNRLLTGMYSDFGASHTVRALMEEQDLQWLADINRFFYHVSGAPTAKHNLMAMLRSLTVKE